jgi:type IV pilus assembly protein PilA
VLKHPRMRSLHEDDDKGFTLIELMVVVLIMGILMAIAIPTFLSSRNSANDTSAESNATNAVTSLKSYYSSYQNFTATGSQLDSTLPWSTAVGGGKLYLQVGAISAGTFTASTTSPATGTAFELTSQSKSGNCYWVYDDEGANPAVTAYAFAKAPSGGCGTFPSLAAPGSAGAVATGNSTWETTW